MTLEDFLTTLRRQLRDQSTPYLWLDDDLVTAANKALNDMALPRSQGGASYFYDDTTWAAVAITAADPVVPDTAAIPFSRLMDIRRVTLTGASNTLKVWTMEQFEEDVLVRDYGLTSVGTSTTWEAMTGTPTVLLTNYIEGGLRLYPIPTAAHTMKLWAYRLPANELEVPSTVGATDWKATIGQLVGGTFVEQDERLLMQGAKAYAYGDIHDADTYDQDAFERELGRFRDGMSTAGERLSRKRHPSRPVHINRDYAY